ncbi:hypothetical protein PPACK8108_LOCUS14274 [Phakopsora pachyrhizi]|uniref:Uncharacterized protein n=1 Tax=Phakopsora pachyrhizi TaxID=170000 RepID=A0AAV0B6U0_PHAPC|nr:hypothetical protein PPACK8108_LOCUS14274 [Phakopsora pachyrhizi]
MVSPPVHGLSPLTCQYLFPPRKTAQKIQQTSFFTHFQGGYQKSDQIFELLGKFHLGSYFDPLRVLPGPTRPPKTRFRFRYPARPPQARFRSGRPGPTSKNPVPLQIPGPTSASPVPLRKTRSNLQKPGSASDTRPNLRKPGSAPEDLVQPPKTRFRFRYPARPPEDPVQPPKTRFRFRYPARPLHKRNKLKNTRETKSEKVTPPLPLPLPPGPWTCPRVRKIF